MTPINRASYGEVRTALFAQCLGAMALQQGRDMPPPEALLLMAQNHQARLRNAAAMFEPRLPVQAAPPRAAGQADRAALRLRLTLAHIDDDGACSLC
jgi:hypothetical protein